jgi:hypothetical protein
MKRLALVALLLALAGCKGVGLGQMDLDEVATPAGLRPALETQSAEDKAEDKWFKSYYGTNKSDDQKAKDWWGSYYGSGDKPKGNNSLGW